MDITDYLEIQNLLGQYGHLIDDHDWDAFGALFTPDATLDYTAVRAPRVLHGVGEILDHFRSANHPSAHHVTNVVIEETAGSEPAEVEVHSKFIVPFTRPGHLPTRWYGGDYRDTLVKTADGWRFRAKVCTPRWQMTHHEDPASLPGHRTTF